MSLRKFTGTVLRYVPERGFGFIKIDYPGPRTEAWFHISELDFSANEVALKMKLQFFLEDRKSLTAIRISKV